MILIINRIHTALERRSRYDCIAGLFERAYAEVQAFHIVGDSNNEHELSGGRLRISRYRLARRLKGCEAQGAKPIEGDAENGRVKPSSPCPEQNSRFVWPSETYSQCGSSFGMFRFIVNVGGL